MNENKTLYLVRHGKSSWGYENISDIDRPLKNRGIRNAYEMSSFVAERNKQPDLLISSPANRALHTAIIFASQLKCPLNQLKIDELIYFSDEYTILEFIKQTSDAVSCMMIFGHNPVITTVANSFFKNPLDYIPTTGVVEFTFQTNSWSRINKDNLTKEWYHTPKKNND